LHHSNRSFLTLFLPSVPHNERASERRASKTSKKRTSVSKKLNWQNSACRTVLRFDLLNLKTQNQCPNQTQHQLLLALVDICGCARVVVRVGCDARANAIFIERSTTTANTASTASHTHVKLHSQTTQTTTVSTKLCSAHHNDYTHTHRHYTPPSTRATRSTCAPTHLRTRC
jgi:hypothetical protein